MAELRVLELFSGIGGMHRACQLVESAECETELNVVGAVDINTSANAIYRHNHPDTTHWQRDIKGLTAKDINKIRPDILLMSPPCQPHTRQGKRRDTQDPRSDGLKHLLQLIPEVPTLKYVLLENVQGFESSESRDLVLAALSGEGFYWKEFLINPNQLNIPNSRLRYYLVARKGGVPWGSDPHLPTVQDCVLNLQPDSEKCDFSKVNEKLAKLESNVTICESNVTIDESNVINNYGNVTNKECSVTSKDVNVIINECNVTSKAGNVTINEHNEARLHTDFSSLKTSVEKLGLNLDSGSLNSFLQSEDEDVDEYLLDDKILPKYGKVLDIVDRSSHRTCCFTKAYGHYFEGTGSVLQQSGDRSAAYAQAESVADSPEEVSRILSELKLRFFTPTEISQLMGFPKTFSFPDETTRKQKYKTLGNSLNVHVVAILLHFLIYC